MNKNDLRYLKTEEFIQDSFLTCVLEEGFEKTSVADICKRARISRNTFYAHYEDKYQLLESMLSSFQNMLIDGYAKVEKAALQDGHESSVRWYVNWICENRKQYQALMRCSTVKFLDVLCEGSFHRRFEALEAEHYTKRRQDPSVQLQIEYLLYGMVGFTNFWLDHFDQMSKEEVIKKLTDLCVPTFELLWKNIKNR